MEEKWTTILTHPNYEVSNHGNIRSKDHVMKVTRNGVTFDRYYKGKVLRNRKSGHKRNESICGYYKIPLGRKSPSFFVHRLVATYWISNPLKKEEVNHKDRNGLNNKVDNLEWCTKKENAEHRVYTNRNGFKPEDVLS